MALYVVQRNIIGNKINLKTLKKDFTQLKIYAKKYLIFHKNGP